MKGVHGDGGAGFYGVDVEGADEVARREEGVQGEEEEGGKEEEGEEGGRGSVGCSVREEDVHGVVVRPDDNAI